MSLVQRSPSYGDAVHPAEIPLPYVGSRNSLEVILMRMMARRARTQRISSLFKLLLEELIFKIVR